MAEKTYDYRASLLCFVRLTYMSSGPCARAVNGGRKPAARKTAVRLCLARDPFDNVCLAGLKATKDEVLNATSEKEKPAEPAADAEAADEGTAEVRKNQTSKSKFLIRLDNAAFQVFRPKTTDAKRNGLGSVVVELPGKTHVAVNISNALEEPLAEFLELLEHFRRNPVLTADQMGL